VVADDPRLLALWDAEANSGVDPATLGAGSSRRRFWRCQEADDHRWQAGPSSISKSLEKGFTDCPCCAGRKLSVTNSFAARHPDGVALWHPTRNGELRPDGVFGGSPDAVWWRCPAGPDHEWQAAPLHIGKISIARGNTGCPFCAGQRASVTNRLSNHPQLVAEWHPTANGELTPADVVAGTGKKLWWRCLENPDHEWQATGANRTRGRACPICRKSLRSILEVGLAFELRTLIPELDLADDKVVVAGVVRHVDLLLRQHSVVIEVDGRYRHDGDVQHERDAGKTQLPSGSSCVTPALPTRPTRTLQPSSGKARTASRRCRCGWPTGNARNRLGGVSGAASRREGRESPKRGVACRGGFVSQGSRRCTCSRRFSPRLAIRWRPTCPRSG
jgi:hypothetical protein